MIWTVSLPCLLYQPCTFQFQKNLISTLNLIGGLCVEAKFAKLVKVIFRVIRYDQQNLLLFFRGNILRIKYFLEDRTHWNKNKDFRIINVFVIANIFAQRKNILALFYQKIGERSLLKVFHPNTGPKHPRICFLGEIFLDPPTTHR